LAKSIHTMIRVLDEDRSVQFYDQAFGLKIADRLEFESFTLVYLANDESDFELELTINKSQTDAYDLGNGYGHFSVSVGDLDAEYARFVAGGLSPRKIVDFAPGEETIARFFFVADPDGYEVEVLQRGGRYK